MDLIRQLAKELGIREQQAASAVELLDAGNTIPFIARYRKEATGSLDEVVLRNLSERLAYLRVLLKRQDEVIRLIGEQGKLTPDLEARIRAATVLQEVEDLYLPYRPKRRTRATIAREKGLEPLATAILAQGPAAADLDALATQYVSPERGVETPAEAIAGAADIIAETVAEDADVRKLVRELTWGGGILTVTPAGAPRPDSVYADYYDFRQPLAQIPPHRILALNRGEAEDQIKIKLEAPADEIVKAVRARFVKDETAPAGRVVGDAVADAYDRLIAPSIERELRARLTEQAEEQAIKVFAANLKALLLQPPVRGKVVLGIDPAYRTGCKIAVVDDTGKLLETGVIYPTPPQNDTENALKIVKALVLKHKVDVIAIGNGTGSRETEAFVAGAIKQIPRPLSYVIVSEAGASVYSASKLAGEEFPELDVSVRGAVSIARRLEDPLAELVKIDPKSIGVGQYQHDVNQKRLSETLRGVVEDAVNSVGVDLNTASPSLLSYVAGINSGVARSIVSYRDKHGRFRSRTELLQVPRVGEAIFTQAAGFLRVPAGDDPLDNTPIHPESYAAAEGLLARCGLTKAELTPANIALLKLKLSRLDINRLAEELGVGVPTLKDIIDALERPGRDPRDELPPPVFRTDVVKFEDLRPGMVLRGTVRNVVDFGAFVDIGVKHDGLVHISELSDKYVKHPLDVVKVGDTVTVRVLAVDQTRQRISLTMKGLAKQ